MLQDLAQYDLINLIAAEAWSEEEKAKVVLDFSEALSGFLGERLNPLLTEEDDLAFKQMLQKPDLTQEEVMEFYHLRIPNFEERLESATLEFKKMFLLMVYEKKIKELDQQIQDPKNEEIKPFLLATRQAWQQAYDFGRNDNWHEAAKAISIIQR